MSSDVGWQLGTSSDQCRSLVQCCFTSTRTIRLIRTESPGWPPRLSHSSWTAGKDAFPPVASYIYPTFQAHSYSVTQCAQALYIPYISGTLGDTHSVTQCAQALYIPYISGTLGDTHSVTQCAQALYIPYISGTLGDTHSVTQCAQALYIPYISGTLVLGDTVCIGLRQNQFLFKTGHSLLILKLV